MLKDWWSGMAARFPRDRGSDGRFPMSTHEPVGQLMYDPRFGYTASDINASGVAPVCD